MPLFTSLISSSNTLSVMDQALATVQNNINNASTAGYARQRLSFQSMPFSTDLGLLGGLLAGHLESSRDQYAEDAVRRQQSLWGKAGETASGLSRLEPLFDITGQAGIPGALNRLFQSFSAWSIAPDDTTARGYVIESAGAAAASINDAARQLLNARAATDGQVSSSLDAINALTGKIASLNLQARRDFFAASDPNLDASMASALEELSEYINFTALRQQDGSVTIMAGSQQTPLVIGNRSYSLQAEFDNTHAVLRDAQGNDISAYIGGGRLSGLMELRNTMFPAYVSGLNRLAAGLNDSVNAILNAGTDQNGDPGADLFTCNPAAGEALTLSVTAITPDQLAAATAAGSNANALELAALSTSASIGQDSLMGFYGALARRVGLELNRAQETRDTQEQLLEQARSLRDDVSGVSLDEEAVRLLQFQRSYQATARLIVTLDQLTETAINMMR